MRLGKVSWQSLGGFCVSILSVKTVWECSSGPGTKLVSFPVPFCALSGCLGVACVHSLQQPQEMQGETGLKASVPRLYHCAR